MNLKKGLKLIAFGYLFILLNFNLKSGGISINIFPSFIGYGLIFLGLRQLGAYTKNSIALYILTGIIGCESLVEWALTLTGSQMPTVVDIIVFVLDLVFMYLLFGVLIKVAEDHNSLETRKLPVLRITYIVFAIAFFIFGYLFYYNQSATYYALIAAVLGIIGLFVAISIAVSLFRLSKDVD